MGGACERLVRSVKTALSATLHDGAPCEEVLATLLIEAETMLNGHPLTHASSDPADEDSLTPNHFLLGTPSPIQPPGNFEDGDLCSRKQWRVAYRP